MDSQSFLDYTAQLILQRHGEHIKNCLLLFPNQRSITFFRKALVKSAGKPVWAPDLFSLDGWIKKISNKTAPDELALVIRLYNIWQSLGHQDKFESFYTLGQLIVKDFNSMDEALTDRAKFFRDLALIPSSDIEEIAEIEPALAELALSIRQSELSSSLGKIWQSFGTIYSKFIQSLEADDLSTPGMIYRSLAEDNSHIDYSRYRAIYAVGFYKLNNAESKILSHIPAIEYIWNETRSEVYRDLDWEHAAIKNIDPTHPKHHHFVNPNGSNFIQLFGAAGFQQQIQGLVSILESKSPEELERTAILLPEQGVLLPLLQSIPESVKTLNVSMGISVMDTSVYVLVQRFIDCLNSWTPQGYVSKVALLITSEHELLSEFRSHVLAIDSKSPDQLYWHFDREWKEMPAPWFDLFGSCADQYSLLDRCLKLLSIIYENAKIELDKAAIYQLVLRLQRLSAVLSEQDFDWSPTFFGNFLRRILQHSRLVLLGEPLMGLQVLGMQELPNLNFDHLFILSANEGSLPMISRNSCIPYTLETLYNWPGIKEHTSIQEHIFWSALQSTTRTTIFYNTAQNGMSKTEPSRWLLRLSMGLHPENWKIESGTVTASTFLNKFTPIVFGVGSKEHELIIKWLTKARISPSALNTWLTCRLKFYLQHILAYRESEEASEDFDSGVFGKILHQMMEDLYFPLVENSVESHNLVEMKTKAAKLLSTSYSKMMNIPEEITHSGKHRIYKDTIHIAVQRLLDIDTKLVPFEILSLENELSTTVEHKNMSLMFLGRVDRVDRKEDKLRIVDYKTGTYSQESLESSYEKMWLRDGKNSKEALQTMFYAWLYNRNFAHHTIPETHLYFSSGIAAGKSTKVELKGFETITNELLHDFESQLLGQINEMMSSDLVIDQTEDIKNCHYCPYNTLCAR
jgi:CRISPR/Cas system-associated exonuclease Cas4 (RecB family)